MAEPEKTLFAVIENLLRDMPYQESAALADEIIGEVVYYLRRMAVNIGSIEVVDRRSDRVVNTVERWVRLIEQHAELNPETARQLASGVLFALSNDLTAGENA